MSNFFEELKKRNVYKVATAYAITGWLVIQVVNTVGPNLSWPDSLAPLVTKILLVGFPISLVLTWLYEFTPQGVKRTGKVQEDTSDNRRAGRRLNRVIIGTLALVLCVMLVERVFSGNTTINEKQKASIAVLPFVNISSNEENENFADALTLSIHDRLSKLSGMDIIIAPISSFVFKGKDTDIRNVAQDLGVNYILEGSFQYDRRSNKVKIRTLLRNGNNGYTLDSQSYEYNYDDSFGIQEDVSRQVASELRIQILPDEEKELSVSPSESKEAYKLYTEARIFSWKRNDENLEKAIRLLNKALELDENFAEAHAELSFLYNQRLIYGDLSKEVAKEKVEFHLKKALEINPDKPEVLVAEANYNMRKRKDSSMVIANLRKVVDIKQNYADAYYSLHLALVRAEQRDLALQSMEKALILDPINDFYAARLAGMYSWKDPNRALEMLDKTIRNDSLAEKSLRTKALLVANAPYGDLVQAFKLLHKARKIRPYDVIPLTWLGLNAINLDLIPVSEKYMRAAQMRYPDNRMVFGALSNLFEAKKDLTSWMEWIDFWVTEKDLDAQREFNQRVELNLELGNHEKALRLFEETYPNLIQQDISADSLDLDAADGLAFYVELLRLNMDNQKADPIAREVCKFYDSILETDILVRPIDRYNCKLDCYYISNDVQNFVKLLEEGFFKRKDRLEIFSDIKIGAWALFEDNPDYQALVKRITEETHRMRAEVIAYLKEEGDWDPAWDKELGLE